jgi:hypothetical protein
MTDKLLTTLEDVQSAIRAAIDAAWPAGMSLGDEDFQLEINARLDDVARSYMAQFPHLREMSLDEWLVEHHDTLTAPQREMGREILQAYDEDLHVDEAGMEGP